MKTLTAALSTLLFAVPVAGRAEVPLANGVSGLGLAVALDGDTAVVSGSNRAFVFTRAGGVWAEQQELVPSLPVGGDNYGIAVALGGDTAVVTANFEAGSTGAAFVFERVGSAWTETQVLTASDAAPNAFFGDDVALLGDRLVVGAGDAPVGGQPRGAAYVFERIAGVWTETAKLVPSNPAAGFFFAFSVDLSADRIAAGRFGTANGDATVFRLDGGAWIEEQVITAADGAAGDWFGYSVALDGARLLVGGPRHDAGGMTAGAAWLFELDGGAWVQRDKLTADDASADAVLGTSVALEGGRAVAGAPGDAAERGAAYVFAEQAGSWGQAHKLVAGGGIAGDELGASAALDGATVLAGAPGADAAFAFVLEEPECFLVLGTGRGTSEFTPGSHTFHPQVAEVVEHHAVLLTDLPDFVLPFASPAASPLAHRANLADPSAPVEFFAQVLMWNPDVFPEQPEQWTPGVRVLVFPDGGMLVRRYGSSTGMQILPELGVNAQGAPVLRFPFTIPGM